MIPTPRPPTVASIRRTHIMLSGCCTILDSESPTGIAKIKLVALPCPAHENRDDIDTPRSRIVID